MNIVDNIDQKLQSIRIGSDKEVIICPPYTLLNGTNNSIKNCDKISLGSQDISHKVSGAYTGMISPKMLTDCGCKYSIIGHSESRLYFKYDDETLLQKAKIALEHGITPIYCIGESLIEYKNNNTKNILRDQTKLIPDDIKSKILLAYEPIWAIGSGITPTIEQISGSINFIKKELKFHNVLYGGSVIKSNFSEIISISDGVLIGSMSLNFNDFSYCCNL